MKIWIDGYEANVQQRVGSGQVAAELIKHIERLDHLNDYTVLLPAEPVADLPRKRDRFNYRILRPKRLWTRIALPLAIFWERDKPDIFFSPTHYLPEFNSLKRVMMIMDLGYLHYPEFFKKSDLYKLSRWTKRSVESAAHILTISRSSKKDIIEHYKVHSQRITVAYPGVDRSMFGTKFKPKAIDYIKQKYSIDGEYIIFISTIQPRKNLVRLFEAFKAIEGLKLVIVGKTTGEGKEGWMYQDILSKPKELGIENEVIFTGFVPTKDLTLLLRGAVACIQPSLWEGFGIPVVESMAVGTPVLVANASSLPEIVGEAGLLFDPRSVTQIEQSIRTIFADKKLGAKLSRLGQIRARRFTWERMTKQVLEVFDKVNES